MKNKVMEVTLTFFLSAILIYLGIQLLIKVWWIFAIIIALFLLVVLTYRIRKVKRKW